MGIDYSTYVGPYVECRFGNKETIENRRTCPNKLCKQFGKEIYENSTKFCDQCGSQIDVVEFHKTVEAVNNYELRMSFNEALVTPLGDGIYFWQKENNIHVWIPNQYLMCDEYPRVKVEHRESSIQEIPIELPAAQIAAFKKQFAKELAVLSEAYGADKMTYKWGIIHQVY